MRGVPKIESLEQQNRVEMPTLAKTLAYFAHKGPGTGVALTSDHERHRQSPCRANQY